jgi:hypothetical protein
MSRHAFDNQFAQSPNMMAPAPPVRSGGGWKALFWLAVATAGVGFAGYLVLGPYQKLKTALASRGSEIGAERSAAQEASSERDKLKADMAKYVDADKDKAAADARKRAAVQTLSGALKPAVEEVEATLTAEGASLQISFPAAKVIDPNGIDVSEAGLGVLRAVAGEVKGVHGKVRVRARASSAPPPRELKSLFHSAGEMQAVRAARVMSALEGAGLAPESVSIVGQAEKAGGHARGKKAAVPDRLDIEVEPE